MGQGRDTPRAFEHLLFDGNCIHFSLFLLGGSISLEMHARVSVTLFCETLQGQVLRFLLFL